MQLTIEQALKQAVAAHKEGKLDEAENIYRAILQSQPNHSDANHNLGLIAFSVNQIEAAVPLFKTALDADPTIEQFWLSYVEALVKAGRLKDARQATKRAKKRGFDAKKLGKLLSQTKISTESDAEVHLNLGNTLLGLGRLNEAEVSYGRAIALKPDYAEAYNNLGGTLQGLGRLRDAEASFNQATALKPDYAEAHNNLGNTLMGLGRLNEAVASYDQAIALLPKYAEAHNNLGGALQGLSRLSEAEASYCQAIALKPDYAEAHSNLGNTLRLLGRLSEAKASCTQAIVLKRDHVEAHNNLGLTLQGLGRLSEAKASYGQAIALRPAYAEAMFNLSVTQRYMNDSDAEVNSLQNVLKIDSDGYGLSASVNLAICDFLEGEFTESEKYLLSAAKIQEMTSSNFDNDRVYWRYLLDILRWHKNQYLGVKKNENDKDLYVIGESHSLTSHHLRIQNFGVNFFCSSKLIKGCKQWHLGNAFKNQYKHQFEAIFFSLPKQSDVLLAIGEIDCRIDSGIIMHKKKFPEKQFKEIISKTIEDYLNYVVSNNCDYQHNVTIQGVPCPNIDIRAHPEKEIKQLGEVITTFNYVLEAKSKEKGFSFLDVHRLTNKGDGWSNGSWHIDGNHLSPDGMQEAWRRHVLEM